MSNNWMETASGGRVDLVDLDLNTYVLEDMARSLAGKCRFNDQTMDFMHISVAEHSVRVCDVLPDHLRLFGLAHDMHEGITGDITRPVKRLLPDFRAFELTIQADVMTAFCGRMPNYDEWQIINTADRRMGVTEAGVVLSGRGLDWDMREEYPPYPQVTIECWDTRTAYRNFIERFKELA